MRLVAIRSVTAGAKLAKSIYNDNGQILLYEGVELTERSLTRLYELGISFIYIYDERTHGIEIETGVSLETKRKAIRTIKSEFKGIANHLKLKKSFNIDHFNKDFAKIVRAILTDIKNNENALTLLSDMFVYDSYIFTHSLNVSIYTLGLAVDLGFSDKKLMEIGMGSLLHDIGKMTIPVDILNKPGKLTDEEFKVIQSHSMAGFEILRKAPNISLLSAHCALQHHERLDGTGYPRGLKSNDIHLYAKMITIADVFDAVTSNRVYRKPMLPHEALELLYSGVGKQFDQDLVKAFRRTVAVYPVGLTVTLSDERVGIVVKQNKQLSTHPVVRIIKENGIELTEPYDIDLMERYNITIVETEATLAAATST
ncbi:HD-GYP domain-containing protein [Halalkalibacter alkaliphilus]|uniref:HD-GYP domain-containing protein n=1 Tax=Halalkalibacter alkaliphilus TaxID=2917993 RepID=A0A9X2I628_9BACI|nr:HD-GYP domain-containing protein [Halalkalibacter alkaliphilus]MCL7748971.1 HD-GYP domain-containing protein [Halalkalibacter alkaliphilus]